uniref:meiotic recombination protein SPO11 n=1 Tax=Myxine glutinosa TaxID=7769 RepID=UPI00358FF562
MLAESSVCEVRFNSRTSIIKLAQHMRIFQMIYHLVQTDSFSTKRDIYYNDPKLFGKQAVVDHVIDNISCMLQVPRSCLHVTCTSKGCVAGDLRYIENNGAHVDCNSSANGVLISTQVEGIQYMSSKAQFVLVVEKDATFQKLLDDGFCVKMHPCILITGKGVPDVNTRLLLHKISNAFPIPIFALVDADPHGIEIMTIYKYGSLSMSFDASNLTVPTLHWLGLLPSDIERLDISKGVRLPMTPRDRSKVQELIKRPYIKAQPLWRKELERLEACGEKAEIQSLTSLSSSFLAQVYLPNKLHFGGWI